MNFDIREATLNDLDKGLLKVFIEGYRYHQNGRPDIFINVSNDTLKEDLNSIIEENLKIAEESGFLNSISPCTSVRSSAS